MIKSLLDPSRYDPTSRPGKGDYLIAVNSPRPSMYSSDENSGATNIYVNMDIQTIKSVDLENMEMILQITLR